MMNEDSALGFLEKFEAEDYGACSEYLAGLSLHREGSKAAAALLADSLPALRSSFRSRLRDSRDGAEVAIKYLHLCGGAGAEFLLEWLEEEQEKRVRSRVISLAEKPDHRYLLKGMEKRLADPRWFVVRNMVTIAGRLNLPDGVPLMEQALQGGDVRVAKEIV